ncbi:hypothetical protein BTO19_23190 [Vibrio parahaemolyticus]|uniref:PcfJ domain-containing protein n=1 Tax=Vibrio harveyi group TaxID=717610 RepID=UPI000A2FF725|nr:MULTISPECIES: PcfJ domain-containing protein [Vibrio harveyi group]ARR48118.1 hypothetical protein CAY59_28330 [Vibrio campbellii]MDF4269729.1 PcfJ domain-containing protein [Vibrio parahaemolyticus]MDF4275065.1 PcfJ domain-containing protein [Vibrio parahaemolyticus]MDF4299657.1 PcfJ domain-containing protein [Vibrio parahaemolyticus]OUJ23205.1 hypothetical protein BTO19_23190 [Vibrio parahaemolyticus]
MNALTQITVPNTHVYLSNSVLEALMQHYYLPMQEETMTPILRWSDLRQWIDSQKWMRMVERGGDKNLDTLVIFGLFRIAKNKQTKKIKMQRKTLRGDKQGRRQWHWVSASYVPKLNMQNCKSDALVEFKETLSYALDALFQDLAKQGVVAVELSDKRKKIPVYRSTVESFDETPRTVYDVDLRQPQGRDSLISRITAQCFVLTDNAKFASRYWYKQVWDFVDKERLSLLMKIRQCSLSQLNYKEVHQFTQVMLDADDFKANERWLPWLTFVPKKHFNQPNLFSYESLLAHLPQEVSKNAIRKINRQPRQIQAFLIKAKMWTSAELALVDALQGFPTTIQIKILTEVKDIKNRHDFCNECQGNKQLEAAVFQRCQRVMFRWALYFQDMAKQVKVRKQRAQWYRALHQFSDVIHWVYREEVSVHKNQTWYSLVQQHDRWIAQINERDHTEERERDSTTWKGAQWSAFDTQDVVVEEITQGKRLREEGREMEHCVFSYFNDCVRQRYRVFSLMSGEERATLGLYVDAITCQCRYDQLRGHDNAPASNKMHSISQRLISQINQANSSNDSHSNANH